MKFEGGVKAAAKMLSGLSKEERIKVLETIEKTDPRMAQELHKNLYTFDDLEFLTSNMLIELLKEVKTRDMGLALRISSGKLKDHVLKNIPKLMRQEIEEILMGPPQLSSIVEEAQEKIMSIVIKKIDKGELIINREDAEKLV